MIRRLMVSWVCMAGLLATSVPSGAQTSGAGSIRGTVTDQQQGRLADVALTAVTAGDTTARTAVSDAQGRYRLTELPPGTYTITAERTGFARLTMSDVVIRAGLNLELPVSMAVAAQQTEVQVTGELPMLESSTSSRAVNVSGSFQRALPVLSRQNWYDFMQITPGVVTAGIDVGGAQAVFLHGSPPQAQVFQVDGADVSTSFRSSQLSAFLMRMSSDSTDDVQIKTAAVDASSPLGIGAMVSVVGQSGTNVPQGSVSWTMRPLSWVGNNNPGGTVSALHGSNVDLSLGGPLKRDHLWAFGTARFIHTDEGISRTADQIQLLSVLNPSFEPFDNTNRGSSYYGKLTGQFSANQQFSLVAQNEFYDQTQDIGDYGSHIRGVSFGGPFTTGRWQSVWGSSLTTTVTATYNAKSSSDFTLYEDKPGIEIYNSVRSSGGSLVGVGRLAVLDSVSFTGSNGPLRRTTLSADATYYRAGARSTHEIKAGLYFVPRSRVQSISHAHNNGAPVVYAVLKDPANPAAGYTPFSRRIYEAVDAPTLFSDHRDIGAYVQDVWRPTSRLTVSAGVRVDYVVQHDKLFNVKLQNSIDVGPRLGVNYALTRDGRNIVRASWGKIHDNLTSTVNRAGSNVVGFRDEVDTDLNGTFETVFTTPTATAINPDRRTSPEFHQPYILESTVGYQRQLPGRMTIGANLMRRAYRDVPVAVDTNGIYEGRVFKGYANPAFNQIVEIQPNRFFWPIYTALDLQVSKESERVQLLGSYVRAWRHLTGSWAPNDPASFIQPDAFANDKGIGSTGAITSTLTSGVNSLSGSAYTGYQAWRDHVVRLAANGRGPWQIRLATVYTFQSGVWSGPVVRQLAAADPSFGPATVTLSNGRVVSNPLATVVRFAYASAGENQFTSDDVHTWNVRVGRVFSWGRWRVEPSLDVLNVVNAARFQQFMGGANDLTNANYQKQTFLQTPRQAMFSLRVTF